MKNNIIESCIIHPIYVWIFQTNRRQLEIMFPKGSLKGSLKGSPNGSSFNNIQIKPQRRLDFLAKSHLCVILAKKLVSTVKYPQKHGLCILSRQHFIDYSDKPSTSFISSNIISFTFHSTAPIIVVGTSDGYAKIWWVFPKTGPGPSPAPICIATLDGIKKKYNSQNYGKRLSFSIIKFHPSIPILAANSADNTVKLYNVNESNSDVILFDTLDEHIHYISAIDFHQILPIIVTCGEDLWVKIWRFDPMKSSSAVCLETFVAQENSYVRSIAIHPNKPFLVTSSSNYNGIGETKLWQLNSEYSDAKFIKNLEEDPESYISLVEFHPNANIMVTCSNYGVVKLWQVNTMTCLITVTNELENKIYNCYVNYHPSAPFLIIGINNNIQLWRIAPDFKSATFIKKIREYDAILHPTLPIMATRRYDGTIKIWE